MLDQEEIEGFIWRSLSNNLNDFGVRLIRGLAGRAVRAAAHTIFEAADQDRNDALATQDATWHEIEEGHLARIEELEAENERLRDELDDCKKANERFARELVTCGKEILRLLGQVEQLQGHIDRLISIAKTLRGEDE